MKPASTPTPRPSDNFLNGIILTTTAVVHLAILHNLGWSIFHQIVRLALLCWESIKSLVNFCVSPARPRFS